MIACGDHSGITRTLSTNLLHILQQYSNTLTSNRHKDFFEADRVFDPRIITGTQPASHDIAQYKAIPWFMKDMDNRQLLEEWSIYVMQMPADLRPYTNVGRDFDAMENFDIMPILERQMRIFAAFGMACAADSGGTGVISGC